MSRPRGNPGLKGRLLAKGIESYILALETINRLSIKYRGETFCYLLCNAWELLLKARILAETHRKHAIYYDSKPDAFRGTLSLRACLNKVFPNENDPTRRNLEWVAELRDRSAHLVIGQVPRDILCLFQASVLNYHKKLGDWFDISLSEKVPVGMMTLVYDLAPQHFDLQDPVLRRRLGRDTTEFLAQFEAKTRAEFDRLEKPAEFSIGVEYRLVLTKNPSKADICLSHGTEGVPTQMVEVPRDPSVSHPFRQKEVLDQLKASLGNSGIVNQFDFQCVKKVHAVQKRSEFFYQGKVKGSPAQYSQTFLDWILIQFKRDSAFFVKARRKAKSQKKGPTT